MFCSTDVILKFLAYCTQAASVENETPQILRFWISDDVLSCISTLGLELHHQRGLLHQLDHSVGGFSPRTDAVSVF